MKSRRGFIIRGAALIDHLDGLVRELADRHPGRRISREGLAREFLLVALADPRVVRRVTGGRRRVPAGIT